MHAAVHDTVGKAAHLEKGATPLRSTLLGVLLGFMPGPSICALAVLSCCQQAASWLNAGIGDRLAVSLISEQRQSLSKGGCTADIPSFIGTPSNTEMQSCHGSSGQRVDDRGIVLIVAFTANGAWTTPT
jgi:hypothetical protein